MDQPGSVKGRSCATPNTRPQFLALILPLGGRMQKEKKKKSDALSMVSLTGLEAPDGETWLIGGREGVNAIYMSFVDCQLQPSEML